MVPAHLIPYKIISLQWVSLKGIRPALPAMEHRSNLHLIALNSVGGYVGGSRYHQFACSGYTSCSARQRKVDKTVDGFPDAMRDFASCQGSVFGDIVTDGLRSETAVGDQRMTILARVTRFPCPSYPATPSHAHSRWSGPLPTRPDRREYACVPNYRAQRRWR